MAKNLGTYPSQGEDNIKVAIRVRPAKGEKDTPSGSSIVSIEANEIVVTDPTYQQHDWAKASCGQDMWETRFRFDHCFHSKPGCSGWSTAAQADVFKQYGHSMVNNAVEGYNCSLFAYGQTGSGKTYTMLGKVESGFDLTTNEDLGFVPRLCQELFNWIELNRSEGTSFLVEAAYFEIYNEKVYDLLAHDSKNKPRTGLRVREHPKTGSYVEDLKMIAVKEYGEVKNLLQQGTESRTTAATLANEASSRSHAVFQIQLTQICKKSDSSGIDEKSSRISLVDLAGSERVLTSGVSGLRLKEAQNINKSLSTLSDVIKALSRAGGKPAFVPYRNSTLTWLLKDSLGGNAKTIMLAAISPEPAFYNESLMTLKYAERVKRIVNKAKVNTGSNADVINSLKQEIKELKLQLQKQQQSDNGSAEAESVLLLQERLLTEEKLMQQLTLPWEQKRRESEVHLDRINQENKTLKAQQEAMRAEMAHLKKEKSDRELQKSREEQKRKERAKRHKLQLEFQMKRRKDDQSNIAKRLSSGKARISTLQEELNITRQQRNELENSLSQARERTEEQRIRLERLLLKEKAARAGVYEEKEEVLSHNRRMKTELEERTLQCLNAKLDLFIYLVHDIQVATKEALSMKRNFVSGIKELTLGGEVAATVRRLLGSICAQSSSIVKRDLSTLVDKFMHEVSPLVDTIISSETREAELFTQIVEFVHITEFESKEDHEDTVSDDYISFEEEQTLHDDLQLLREEISQLKIRNTTLETDVSQLKAENQRILDESEKQQREFQDACQFHEYERLAFSNIISGQILAYDSVKK